MYRLKGRPPGQVKATALGTDASPPRSVVPGCSTPTKTRTVPSVRGWAPRRPPRLPHEQVGLHSGPRHAGEAGTPTGRSGASESLPPRGKSPAWGSPQGAAPRPLLIHPVHPPPGYLRSPWRWRLQAEQAAPQPGISAAAGASRAPPGTAATRLRTRNAAGGGGAGARG